MKFTSLYLQVIVLDVLFEDRGAALFRTAQMLPALRILSITYEGQVDNLRAPITDSHGLPECKELATLRSCSLSELTIWMLGGPPDGNTLQLSGLPQLQSLTLRGGDPSMPLNLHIDAMSFHAVPQLRRLRVENDSGLQLQHGSFNRLSALKKLGLKGCGLTSLPDDIASISATLRGLDLSYNCIQISGADVAMMLQCSNLQALDLHRPDISKWEGSLGPAWHPVEQHVAREGYIPVQLSADSVEQLIHLPDAFRVRHGRPLHVCLKSAGVSYNVFGRDRDVKFWSDRP